MPMGARNALTVQTVQGDLLRVPADAIVNPWNRNYMPRWLRPGGISGQLQAATGPGPWDELASHGLLQLGEAVVTSAGQLTTARSLIHVAGLNLLWRASPRSVALSVHSAVEAAVAHRFATITMPLIGVRPRAPERGRLPQHDPRGSRRAAARASTAAARRAHSRAPRRSCMTGTVSDGPLAAHLYG